MKSEVESLIYLLEDPDPLVQKGVRERLEELGENAVPLLDQYRTSTSVPSEKKRLEEILHKITFSSLYEEFLEILEEGFDSPFQLEKAVFLLARFGNPTLRTEVYRNKLDRFADDISDEILLHEPGTGRMHTLLRYVFRELRFHGDLNHFHDPENSYMDRVIDRRKGLPLSLSLVVIFLARRLGLPFFGVNMPIHFMMLYQSDSLDVSEEILIDPFDGGSIVSYDQCHYFLKKNGIQPRPEHFRPCTDREIFVRAVRNLIHSHTREGREEKVEDLQRLLEISL